MLFSRYIRLTGVYAIIIGLHATLLKFLPTGPQSQLVTSLVTKCQNGQAAESVVFLMLALRLVA